ncbi:hypothetical protein O3G_MSEX009462 [Manduca sexta]|uniref:Uncharacterized protein n=1 Tax=Manduca sexta TaxID=7130 RepID=A0A921ZDF2_MANSE|nr:hypothetical protein O3G_MSEX009462 [Manduca sexta]
MTKFIKRHLQTMTKLCPSICPTLPVVRKCCFCVPVRKGVTIFGYVNLVLSLLSLPLLVFLVVEQMTIPKAEQSTAKPLEETHDHLDPLIHLSLTIAFITVDVTMTIVLLVGAHKKKKSLLKIYLYFGIVFQLLTLCVDLAYFDYVEYIENTVYFFFLALNVYLLFLVNSTIHVIEESSEVQYVVYQETRQSA